MFFGHVDFAQHPHAAQFLLGRLQDVQIELCGVLPGIGRFEDQPACLAAVSLRIATR